MKAEIKRNFVYISRGSKCLHIPSGWRIQAILLLSFPTPTFPSLLHPYPSLLHPYPSLLHPYPSPYINISHYPSLAYSRITLPLLSYFYTFYPRLIPYSLSFFFLFSLYLALFLTPSPFLSFPSLPRLIPFSLSFFFLFSLSLALFLHFLSSRPRLKGTVNEISKYPSFKESNARFSTVLFNSLSSQ